MNFQDSITCPICFGQYDVEDHIPRILPCGNGHSMCSSCILHLLFSSDDGMVCPFDRSQIRLKERSLSDFPQNLALKYFLIENSPASFCQVHEKKKLDIVCIDCRCRICYVCEKRQHQGHTTDLLEDLKLKIEEKAARVREWGKRIEDALTKPKKLIEKKEAKLIEAIDKRFEEYITKILEKRESIKETMRKQLKKLNDDVRIQQINDNRNSVKWAESAKVEFEAQALVESNDVDEKLLYVLMDKELSLSDSELEKWLQSKKEQSELLLCTLDGLDEGCQEMLKNGTKNIFN